MDNDFLRDLFAPFADVEIKRMFGGKGIFLHGLNFAAIMGDALRLKADETTIPHFEAEGGQPFTYERKDSKRVMITSYWSVPERLLDDPEEFAIWAERAFQIALKADAAKPPKQRKYQDPMRAG